MQEVFTQAREQFADEIPEEREVVTKGPTLIDLEARDSESRASANLISTHVQEATIPQLHISVRVLNWKVQAFIQTRLPRI